MTSLIESDHLSVPFQDIVTATKNFTTFIGKGGYGQVYKGELLLSGELRTVAVKRLSTKESKGGQGIKEFLTEIQLLSRYKHQNIVSFLGFCKQGDEKILIYEYAEHGSLDTYLSRACTFTWKQRINICIDAAYGLDHLHNHVSDNHRVIHRDIKSGNILLGHNLKAMIADLGLSKRGLTNDNDSYIVTHACGTDAYLDPEYRRTGILTKESDIYSFGVVLFEVLCGRLSYMNVQDNRRYLDQLARRSYKEHKLEEIIDASLKDKIDSNSLFTYSKIAYECLLINRPERPAIATVVKQLKDALKFQADGHCNSSVKAGLSFDMSPSVMFSLDKIQAAPDSQGFRKRKRARAAKGGPDDQPVSNMMANVDVSRVDLGQRRER
ncbi:receptor-like protein kinase HERK 1 [Rutidosis leptorrhynchoides]|uniref:receptor-like protein kinase HERK 1 n=1 Tax=Rutidosis leptorrhynchoides TaxID=125765 RepID=UPI003A99C1A3